MAGAQLFAEHGAGLLRHGVVTTGEHIHSGIARFGPGVDGDVGLRQQSQARYALGLELVGDEIQKSGASPFGCLGDGASEKDFVVELAGVAVVELENACLLYTSPSPRDYAASRMPSSA